MKGMSDTPRTDEAWGRWHSDDPVVSVHFARELEREVNKLTKGLETILGWVNDERVALNGPNARSAILRNIQKALDRKAKV